MPRMTTAERAAIATPASGLQVYDTTTNTQWYYNGTAWVNTQDPNASSKWTNDATNTLVKLTNLSDGTTTRPAGKEFVALDNGNVAIGRTTAPGKLTIQSKVINSWPIWVYSSQPGIFGGIYEEAGADSGQLRLYLNDGVDYAVSLASRGDSWINNTSEFGLGTKFPTYKLDVVNTTNNAFRFQNSTGESLQATVGTSLVNFNVKDNAGVIPFTISTNGNEVFRVSDKKIGINNNNPSYNLDVYTQGDNAFSFLNGTGFNERLQATIGTSGVTFNVVSSLGGIPFIIKTAGVESFRINNDGKVGIGVPSPSQAIDVAGAIKIGDNTSAPTAGVIRWNATVSKFQGYDGTTWVDFH